MNYDILPKIELHLHLDCSVSYAVASALSPALTPHEFREEFIAPARCQNLADYLSRAVRGFELMQSARALEWVAEDLLGQLRKDKVIYAEVRFAPLLHTRGGLSPEAVVEAVLGAFQKAAGPAAQLILCTLRRFSGQESMATARLAQRYLGQGVCGFDIAGDEAGHPLAPHLPAFRWAAEHGVPATAHAGEACGAESVAETLSEARVQRLGHGVRIVEGPAVLAGALESGIHFEVCPTSNLQTGVFPNLKAHSMQELYRKGASISINTDGRTLSNVTLADEYRKVEAAFGWGREELLQCNLAAAEASFLPENRRQALKLALAQGWANG
ncbi:adenosine deaminase [Phaeodactylibacter luteus]|uniref:adenosine deaminase n=1 Tax=Phaeodactylibacter luteus TaxID=1564516 RepID=A0A5C6RHI6_9BACT|nr:adenosine deaminase [Phaeodactylibacter luteus]TXB61563.1 adenosine deaminase [Phaeodactylibacter luteus]